MPNLLNQRLAAAPNPDATEAYARGVLMAALARVCANPVDEAGEAKGFEIAECGALEGMADAVKRYIMLVGSKAAELAESNNHREVTLADVEDAADLDWTELKRIFSGYKLKESTALPDFPWQPPPASEPPVQPDERRPLGPHYPPLPPAHTYKRTRLDVVSGLSSADVTDLKRAAQERRTLVRESLAKLLRKESEASSSAPTKSAAAARRAVDSSLAPVAPGDFDAATSR